MALGIGSDMGSGSTAEGDWKNVKVEHCQASWAEARNILGMDRVIGVCELAEMLFASPRLPASQPSPSLSLKSA